MHQLQGITKKIQGVFNARREYKGGIETTLKTDFQAGAKCMDVFPTATGFA